MLKVRCIHRSGRRTEEVSLAVVGSLEKGINNSRPTDVSHQKRKYNSNVYISGNCRSEGLFISPSKLFFLSGHPQINLTTLSSKAGLLAQMLWVHAAADNWLWEKQSALTTVITKTPSHRHIHDKQSGWTESHNSLYGTNWLVSVAFAVNELADQQLNTLVQCSL